MDNRRASEHAAEQRGDLVPGIASLKIVTLRQQRVRSLLASARGHGRTPKEFVGYYSRFDQIYRSDAIARAGTPSAFRYAPTELVLTIPMAASIPISDYLDRNPVTALLITRGDTILYERYR
jgi:hypothetical protein